MLRLVLLLLSFFRSSSASSQPEPDKGSGWDPNG